MIQYIHENGMLAGIAIKPTTPVDVLWEILGSPKKEQVPDVRLSHLNQGGVAELFGLDGACYDCTSWIRRAEVHGVGAAQGQGATRKVSRPQH